MLAFSGCDFGGGEKERNELGAIRKRWKTLHVSLQCFTNVFKLRHLIAILYYIIFVCVIMRFFLGVSHADKQP